MNVDTSVVRQKVDLRRTFHFDTRIHHGRDEVYVNFSIYFHDQPVHIHEDVSVRYDRSGKRPLSLFSTSTVS
jgi:hypothetical protein